MIKANDILRLVDKKITESSNKSDPYFFKLKERIWYYLWNNVTDSTTKDTLYHMIKDKKLTIPDEFMHYSQDTFLICLTEFENLVFNSENDEINFVTT